MMASGPALTLIGFLVVLALVAGAAYFIFRVDRTGVGAGEDPRALLDRRLVTGEITSDEYLERESALRAGQPRRPACRGR